MRTKHTAIPNYYPDCPQCLQLLRLSLLNERFRSYSGICAVCSLVVKCSWKCAQLKTQRFTSQISGRGEGQSPLERTVNMCGNYRENLHHTNAVTSGQSHMKCVHSCCSHYLTRVTHKVPDPSPSSCSRSFRPIIIIITNSSNKAAMTSH
jgi:hypothetical protein